MQAFFLFVLRSIQFHFCIKCRRKKKRKNLATTRLMLVARAYQQLRQREGERGK